MRYYYRPIYVQLNYRSVLVRNPLEYHYGPFLGHGPPFGNFCFGEKCRTHTKCSNDKFLASTLYDIRFFERISYIFPAFKNAAYFYNTLYYWFFFIINLFFLNLEIENGNCLLWYGSFGPNIFIRLNCQRMNVLQIKTIELLLHYWRYYYFYIYIYIWIKSLFWFGSLFL